MSRPRIVVIGSSNTDLVVSVDRIPSPGETVLGGDLRTIQGGKGANQAVAAARLGGEVHFVARVGDDAHGAQALAAYRAEGISTKSVLRTTGHPTGVALIPVERSGGQNAIVVAPGANARLCPEDIHCSAPAIRAAHAVVVSLEVPIPAIEATVRIAKDAGATVILNPAPACDIDGDWLDLVDWIVPNESEAERLGGADALARRVPGVVVTRGGAGADLFVRGQWERHPAPKVDVRDTVAAGDCFVAAFAIRIAEGADPSEAVAFAVRAASLKVTRVGAQPGLPYRTEVESALD